MSNINTTHIITQNDEFVNEINVFFNELSRKDNVFFVNRYYTLEESLVSFTEELPNSIIIDLTQTSALKREFLTTLNVLSSFELTKGIPICCVFNSEEQSIRLENLLVEGVSLFHIMGNDLNQTLYNLFYITYEFEFKEHRYALAKGYEIDFELKTISNIHCFNKEFITFDTDFNADSSITVDLQFFEEIPRLEMPVLDFHSEGASSNMMYNVCAKIPFSSDWEETENIFFEDTYQSWIESTKMSYKSKNIKVLFYTKRISIFTQVFSLLDGDENIKVKTAYKPEHKDIYNFKPELIIFDISNEDDYEEFHHLASDLSYSNHSDIIILVFNHKSHSNALQTLYEYDKIISSRDEGNYTLLKQIFDSLRQKSNSKDYFFLSNDKRKICYRPLDVKITSISENSITFKTKQELPYYTVMKLDIPIHMYILIVPSKLNLSVYPDGYHYQAIIMGIDSKSSEYLSKYVNRLISEPPAHWEYIDLDIHEAPKLEDEQNVDDESEEIEQQVASEEIEEHKDNSKDKTYVEELKTPNQNCEG